MHDLLTTIVPAIVGVIGTILASPALKGVAGWMAKRLDFALETNTKRVESLEVKLGEKDAEIRELREEVDTLRTLLGEAQVQIARLEGQIMLLHSATSPASPLLVESERGVDIGS